MHSSGKTEFLVPGLRSSGLLCHPVLGVELSLEHDTSVVMENKDLMPCGC